MTKILMFHRVLPKAEIIDNDAYFLRGTLISQERLENIIVKYLKEDYVFKTICNLEKKTDLKQVALTFDDGYVDNYLYAKPILEKYDVKATFYPVIGYCLEQTIAPLDFYYQYVNENISSESKEEWIVGKHKKEFLNLPMNKQRAFVKTLFYREPKTKVSYMTTNQLQELQVLGHEIGGHSYYHDIYTRLTKNKIIEDIQRTKKALLQIGIDIKSYAYTDGQYNLEVVQALEDVKIRFSCAIKSKRISDNENLELERKFITENEFNIKELFGISLSVLELNIFLEKIDVLKKELSLSFLNDFILKVLSNIPFQNYKMVERGFGHIPTGKNIKEDMLSLNGGTCATMNIFVGAVLYKIGFNVSLIHGTMMNENDHIAILLNFEDGFYIIDLGDGQPYFEPILTTENILRKHPFRTYRTINKTKELRIDFLIKGKWLTDVTFSLIPKTYNQVYKTLEQHYTLKEFGPFWKGVRFAIYPNKKIIGIRNKTFILQKNDLIEKIEMKDKAHLKELVNQYLPEFKESIVQCFTKQELL
ncbi:polysaccharide deacetylase family protein [Bizionia sp. M204]|uniref:polysaccharide deacetylase family protein n=1 Tax=Bizionia sp. M204 TaxID=2675331 RepID=UPI0020BD4FE9|nr:polysaccharide deacetylase family protein [Bizionia sp. M204]